MLLILSEDVPYSSQPMVELVGALQVDHGLPGGGVAGGT